MNFRLLLLSFMFSAVTLMAYASNPDTRKCCKKNDVAGGVIHANTRKPISNVSVTAYVNTRKEKMVVTDGNGNYDFTELKPGIYKLVFEKDGFKKIIKEKIVIRPDEGCQLNIEMNEEGEFQIMPGQLIFSDYL